ncbi:MAG: 7-cyano-7-deazaguanine synthase QueC [Methermicoccaceae archaeon]
MDCVLLLSGGLDSLVCLSILRERFDNILAITFDYGQRPLDRELAAAKAIAQHYEVEHRVIPLEFLADTSQDKEVPILSQDDLNDPVKVNESARQVWVPARNLVMLSVACSIAERVGAKTVAFGANAEEGVTFPDNSKAFVDAFNKLVEVGTLSHPAVVAPLIEYDKSEIVRIGAKLNAPFELSWSCYLDGNVPCGVCESCVRRKRAFEEAGVVDSLEANVNKKS